MEFPQSINKLPNKDTEAPASEFSTELQEKLPQLASESIISVDMHITDVEKVSLENFDVAKPLNFNNYHSSGPDLINEISKALQEIGQNDEGTVNTVSALIARLTESVKSTFGADSAWLAVRFTLPSEDFDIPRWHSDGPYYQSENKSYKMVATLVGAQTLFAVAKDLDTFNKVSEDSAGLELGDDIEARMKLDEMIEEVVVSVPGEAVVYQVGGREAAIHSEPPMNSPRIFVSILPGSFEQIEEWREG
jgi:hypothetical protein